MPSPQSDARALFEQAVQLPPALRMRLLDERCAGEPDLRRQVQDLLLADARTAGFLDEAAVAAAAASQPLVGRTLGNYRIVRHLGSGGMGTVFEAMQKEPARAVALKILRGSLATPAMLARFHREAALLARLEHPGIARIYESGTMEIGGEGVPFLAMELVPDARDLCAYATHHRLDRRQRLQLFAAVCEAVAKAHELGVVHRDLKPGNILVGTDGRPRVIDFGIARALDAGTEDSLLATRTGQFVGTPRYMSPEQLRGDPKQVDIRSDVWSLGLVLQELLTGGFPFAIEGKSITEIATIVAERDPRRLSAADPTLRGDLEIIVSHCLRKAPDERHASAGHLQREVERFLAGEPILARADHTLYVLRRRLRRHRAMMVAAGTIVVAAIGSGIGFALLWQQAVEARDQSERSLYENQVALAANALRTFRIPDAKHVLDECAPDLRRWEWHHLKARCDDALWTVRPWEETTTIRRICVSSDGALLAAALSDGSVGLLDATDGSPRGRLRGHRRDVIDVAFVAGSPTRLVSVSWDNTARLWDLESGQELRRLQHDHEVWFVETTADGRWILTGDDQGVLRGWDTATGALRWTQRHHRAPITALALNDAGTVLASGSRDCTICLCDVATGALARRIDKSVQKTADGLPDVPAHGSPVMGLAFQRGDRFLFSAAEDGTGKMWDTASGVLLFFEATGHQLGQIATSPDGAVLAMTGRDAVVLRNTLEGIPLEPLRGHDGWVAFCGFTPDGQLLVADEHEIRRFDVGRRSGAHALGRMSGLVFALRASADRSVFCVGDEAGKVEVRAAEDLTRTAFFQAHPARIRTLRLDRDGRRLWTAADDRKVRAWHLPAAERFAETDCPPYPQLAWAPGYVVLAGAGPDLIVRSDVDLSERRRVTTDEPVITGLATTGDGARILSGGRSGWISAWDASTLQRVDHWPAHSDQITQLVPSPDGSQLLSCAKDGTMKVWVLADHSLRVQCNDLLAPSHLTWSPDGTRIVCSTMRGTPRLFAADSGRILLQFDGEFSSNTLWRGIEALDGGRFVAIESAGGIRVWSTDSVAPR